jgi:hypothetical protein
MRRFLTVLVAALLVLGLNAQEHKEKPRIKGSGKIVTKEISVSSFDQLSVSGVFNVLLTQGNKEEVRIEADDNLQDLFEVKNDGSKLNIGMKKDINFDGEVKLKVYVTFKKLKSMDLKTVGNISSEANLNFDDLDISNKSVGSVDLKMTAQTLNVDNKSVGNVKLNGKAQSAVIKNKGVGSVQAGDFVVEKMNIENNGVGSATVNATKEIIVKDSFLGKVTNKGSAPMKKLNKEVI